MSGSGVYPWNVSRFVSADIISRKKMLLFSYQYYDSHFCPINLVHAKCFSFESYYYVFIREALGGILAFGQIIANHVN